MTDISRRSLLRAAEGGQYVGEVAIDSAIKALTVKLIDITGAVFVDDNTARRQAVTPIGSAGGPAGRSPVTQPGVRSPLARMMGRPMARTTASSVPTTRTWVRARVRAV